jgi:hypothetical protein
MRQVRQRIADQCSGGRRVLARAGAFSLHFVDDDREWLEQNCDLLASRERTARLYDMPFAALRGIMIDRRTGCMPLGLPALRFVVEHMPIGPIHGPRPGYWLDGNGRVFNVTDGTQFLREPANIVHLRRLCVQSFLESAPMLDGRVAWAGSPTGAVDARPLARRLRWRSPQHTVALSEIVDRCVEPGLSLPLLPLLPRLVDAGAGGTTRLICMPVQIAAHWVLLVYATQANSVHLFDPDPTERRFVEHVRPLIDAMAAPQLALLPADVHIAHYDSGVARARCCQTDEAHAALMVAYAARQLMQWTGELGFVHQACPQGRHSHDHLPALDRQTVDRMLARAARSCRSRYGGADAPGRARRDVIDAGALWSGWLSKAVPPDVKLVWPRRRAET